MNCYFIRTMKTIVVQRKSRKINTARKRSISAEFSKKQRYRRRAPFRPSTRVVRVEITTNRPTNFRSVSNTIDNVSGRFCAFICREPKRTKNDKKKKKNYVVETARDRENDNKKRSLVDAKYGHLK